MKKTEIEFFDEFRKTESLLNNRFDCKSGVSEYITRMTEAQNIGEKKVPDWNEQYKTIKHLRWVRNQIAHNAETADICKKEDLKDLKAFHKTLLAEKDPISLITRKKKGSKDKGTKPLYVLIAVGIAIALIRLIVLYMDLKK